MKLEEKMMLWSDRKVSPDGTCDFQPYMTPYLLPGDKVRGCVIVLPGGGYSNRARHEAGPIAERFNSQGFHAFVVEYRVAPYRFPAPQEDALRAIKVVRAHAAEWKIKPDKIAILGFSAGGHLACSAGVFYDKVKADNGDECDAVSARPDAEILCYPVISGDPACGHMGSFTNLLGPDVPQAEYLKYSCERLVTEQTPPAFLWHTAEDNCVPVKNSLDYALALKKFNIPFGLHVFPFGSHGLGLAENNPKLTDVTVWPELAGTWLKKMGF